MKYFWIFLILFTVILILYSANRARRRERYDEYGAVPDECGWPVDPRGCPPGMVMNGWICVGNIYRNIFFCPLKSTELKGCKLYEDPDGCPIGESCYLTKDKKGICTTHNDFVYCCPSDEASENGSTSNNKAAK